MDKGWDYFVIFHLYFAYFSLLFFGRYFDKITSTYSSALKMEFSQ